MLSARNRGITYEPRAPLANHRLDYHLVCAARRRPCPQPHAAAGAACVRRAHRLLARHRHRGGAIGAKAEFWTETIAWQWQFKGDDAWLKVKFDKSKHFTGGELHYLPKKDQYALTLRTPKKETLTFTGPLNDRKLTLEREQNGEVHRLVFTFLHPGERYLYSYQVRPAGKVLFAQVPGRRHQGRRRLRRGRRQARVYRQRGPGHHPRHVPGQNVLRLLLGLPNRVQREPREIRRRIRSKEGQEGQIAPAGVNLGKRPRPCNVAQSHILVDIFPQRRFIKKM